MTDFARGTHLKKSFGFTLLEMLLVIAISSAIFVIFIGYTTQKSEELRIDRATLQIQGILNAGLAYYVNNSSWPISCDKTTYDLTSLQAAGYLPMDLRRNPWGVGYDISCNYDTQTFTVLTSISGGEVNKSTAEILAGRIPMGTSGTGNSVSAQVNIPAQSLNNARGVNFAAVYHSGACVPVPKCPMPSMKPTIMVVPVSISGVSDDPTAGGQCGKAPYDDYTKCSNMSLSPISSYTAKALPQDDKMAGTKQAPSCSTGAATDCEKDVAGNPAAPGNYWRVCLFVSTEKGSVVPSNRAWGQAMGSILVITRCSAVGENEGSNFDVWQS